VGKPLMKLKFIPQKKNLYVFCKSGKRSILALKHLNKFGIRGINILGGIDAWNNETN
jgi:adenylyltransferase/sulfurtransferase